MIRFKVRTLIDRRSLLKTGTTIICAVGLLGVTFPKATCADCLNNPNIQHSTLPSSPITQTMVNEVMVPPQEEVSPGTLTGTLVKDSTTCTKSSGNPQSDAAEHEVTLQSATVSVVEIDSAVNSAPPVIDKQLSGKDQKNQFGNQVSFGLPAGSILGTVEKDECISGNGPIVVDNDQALETQETIKYKELPTDEGKTRVLIGAKFPVVVCSQITSKTAKEGDPFEAHLKFDLKIGDRLIASKGALVRGHLNYVLKARSALHSLVSPVRWYRNSGCIGVSFDELINEKGEHIPLLASPAQTARIVKNKYEGRVLGVNHNGQVTGPWSQQLRYKAIRIGLNAAMAPAGVFSFGAMPVALGIIGAANPSFAFMKPVGQNVRHRRIKGFAWGFFSGVPGSWLIEDTVVKGQEAVIMPGDEFLAEFKEEFTGEPMTDASLMPGASTKVHGQVMPVRLKN